MGLRNRRLLLCSAIGVGLPYDVSSWVRIYWIDIDAFHPVKFAMLETLYWMGMESSSMRKHALLMFLYDKK